MKLHKWEHLKKTNKISCPIEITEEILSRLPVKSILQVRSVCKPWLSLISTPIFTKLHFKHATSSGRSALFISAYDRSSRKRHFLSAAQDGGPVTHLITLPEASFTQEHLNWLVLFTSGDSSAFVVNPSTHKVFKLPDPGVNMWNYTCGKFHICGKLHIFYFFGFHESKNGYKILNIVRTPWFYKPYSFKFMIFSMSDYSWRKLDVELPIDISEEDQYLDTKHSVCVNSVIHLMIATQNTLLAFDLTTEKFSIINIPKDAIPHEGSTWYKRKGKYAVKYNSPFLMKINGLLAVVCHDRVLETNEMHIWILQDYENRVWVRETVTFSESWIELGDPYPLDSVSTNEIAFTPKKLYKNMISVPIYDLKTRKFKHVEFFLGQQFLRSKTMEFKQVTSYVEGMLPL